VAGPSYNRQPSPQPLDPPDDGGDGFGRRPARSRAACATLQTERVITWQEGPGPHPAAAGLASSRGIPIVGTGGAGGLVEALR